MAGDRMLHVHARDIPFPTGISEEARTILTAPRRHFPGYPDVGDLDGWRKYAQTVNAAMTGPMQAKAASVDAANRGLDMSCRAAT